MKLEAHMLESEEERSEQEVNPSNQQKVPILAYQMRPHSFSWIPLPRHHSIILPFSELYSLLYLVKSSHHSLVILLTFDFIRFLWVLLRIIAQKIDLGDLKIPIQRVD